MKRKQTKRHSHGLVAVEAAIVLPVIILVTLAGLQYGWLFLKQQEITNVVRHAVRYATLHDVDFGDAEDLIEARLILLGFDIDEEVLEQTVTWVPGTTQGVGGALYAQVSVDAVKVDIINFLPVPTKLTAHATMSKEGD